MIYVNERDCQSLGSIREMGRISPSLSISGHLFVVLLLIGQLLGPACQRHRVLARSESGGLGLDRAEWEQSHGPAVAADSAYVHYKQDEAEVFLNFPQSAPASYIWVRYSTSSAVSIDRARRMAMSLVPIDSILRRTYTPVDGGVAEAFTSTSFARLDEEWDGEPKGSFTVWYSAYDGSVSGFTIRTGKGPLEQ
jgi:hypothetical protein